MQRLIENLLQKIKNIATDILNPIVCQFLEWFEQILFLHFEKKIPNIVLRQRDIYEIELWQNIWSELNKRRPCLVISDDGFNRWNTVVIIPIKSTPEDQEKIKNSLSKILWLNKTKTSHTV